MSRDDRDSRDRDDVQHNGPDKRDERNERNGRNERDGQPPTTEDEYYESHSRPRSTRPVEPGAQTPQPHMLQPRPRSTRPTQPRTRTTRNIQSDQRSLYPRTTRPTQSIQPTQSSQPAPSPRSAQPAQPRPRSTQPVPTRPRPGAAPPPVRQRRGRFWSGMLLGCAVAIVLLVIAAGVIVLVAFQHVSGTSLGGIPVPGVNTSTYTQQKTQPVPLTAITQLQVHNTVGDVTIRVDPNTSSPAVTTVKKVKATSQSDANSQFNNIAIQIQPSGTPDKTLAVTTSISSDTTIVGDHPASVDITILLPSSVNRTSGTPLMLNVSATPGNITSVGNVVIDGLNGVLNVKDDIGNVTVQHAALVDGSCLQTSTGNVNFSGTFDTTTASHLQLCSNTASNGSSTPPQYKMHSEVGDVNIIAPASTNIAVDANINVGAITSNLNIRPTKNTDGSVSYVGPFNPNGGPPTGALIIDVSTGNIHMHSS